MRDMVTHISVTVVSRDEESGYVICRDAMSNEFEIDASVRQKAMGFPDVDERWLLARLGNGWVFDSQIGAPAVLPVSGSRDGMHPVAVQMLEALSQQGLVFDHTFGTVTPPLDDETDPRPDEEHPELPDGPPEEPIEDPDDDPGSIPPNHNGPTGDDGDKKDGWEPLYLGTINLPFTQGNRRVRKDLFRFADTRVQVFGTQEFWPAARNEMISDLSNRGWNYYRPAGHASECTIFWREGQFTKLNQGTTLLSPALAPGAPGRAPSRTLVWVKLRQRSSGRVFFFMDLHYDAIVNLAGNPSRVYDQVRITAQKMQEFGRIAPVFTVGDTNRNWLVDSRDRNPQFPFVKFRSVRTRANWELIEHRPNYGTHGRSLIDTAWFTRPVDWGVRPIDQWILTGYNSDHRPVLVKTKIRSKK